MRNFYAKSISKVFLISLALVTGSMAFACERHIYNNSSATWDIWAYRDKYSDTYVNENPTAHCTQTSPCEIPPNTTIVVSYTTTSPNYLYTSNIMMRIKGDSTVYGPFYTEGSLNNGGSPIINSDPNSTLSEQPPAFIHLNVYPSSGGYKNSPGDFVFTDK